MALATLKEIKELLEKITDKHDPYWERLKEDKRVGVQKLITSWEKQKEKEVQLHNRFIELCIYETEIREQGYTYIAGIDEVGRGPLAGPVVTAAVILPESFYLPGIDDSKKLSEAKREQYYEIIQKQAISIGVGIIEPAEIDRINIYEATKKGMLAAVQNLDQQPDFLLIDAMKLNVPYPSKSIIKGDSKSVSIAAASIIAKVTRDEMMKNLDKEFPAYCFASNMGYGTKDHLLALETEGYTIHHRKSFSPIKEMATRNRGI